MPREPKEKLKSEIHEWIGPVTNKPNSNWCKYIFKVSYNDKPDVIDIRNIKFNPDGTNIFGKGISLTPEECDTTVEILADKGFGDTDKLSEIVAKRKEFLGDEGE